MFTMHAYEGTQGTNRFFTGVLRWGDLDRMLIFPDDLPELDEDHRMQRGLAKRRLQDLEKYLLEADDHFFSALTLVILPRDTTRGAVEADESSFEWDYRFDRLDSPIPGQHRPGLLHLSGDVQLFPADGQHRSYAARLAMRKNKALAKEEVPVVLLAFDEANQVRQLFSDLNLNAKPVSKTIGYDFENRNPLAVMAKKVSEEVELFQGRTQRRTNSLTGTSNDVITLGTLVQGTQATLTGLARYELAGEGRKKDDDLIQLYLDKHGVDQVTQEVVEVWHVIVDAFAPHWAKVLTGRSSAGDLRRTYLFPHGLGWLGLAHAARLLITGYGQDWEHLFRAAVGALDWHRSAPVWVGKATIESSTDEDLNDEDLDRDARFRVNNTGPAITAVATTVVTATA